MRKSIMLLLMGLLCSIQMLWAQNKVSGKVTDKDGAPLPGVTVTVKNTQSSTVTGQDGIYTINAPAKSTLVFSYVGYQTVEVSANGNTSRITMIPGSNSLSEVVVVGYGTSSKRDVTGSIAKVSSKEISNTPATSFETALQGRAAGVYVQQQNGKVGQGINIRIRGASSVTAGNEPLYVIDGIPVITGNFSNNGSATDPLADLNMNDIESIDILKDASAAAIYASRASNGVVLITTKKGKAGQSKIDFNYFTGIQKPTNHRQFLNAQQYVDFFEQAARGRAEYDFEQPMSKFPTLDSAYTYWKNYVETRFNRFSAGTDWKNSAVNTNWEDQAYQRAPISQYDLSFSGGNEKTKYYASGQYLDQKGIMVGNSFKRYSGRLNLDQQVKDWFSFGMNMSFSKTENNRLSNDDQFSTPLQLVALSPITPVIDPRTGLLSGELDLTTGQPNLNYPVYYNPLISIDNSFYKTKVNRSIGNVYGNFTISKGLTFKTELGVDQLNQTEDSYYGKLTYRNTGVPNGYGSYIATEVLNVNTNNYFHYIHTFGDVHFLDVTGGMSYEKGSSEWVQADAQDFPSDAYNKLSNGATKIKANGLSTENSLLSYFLRANYKFNDKYLISVNGRADGSSRFGKNHRYGFFPAASAGWVMSKERFLEDVQWLSFLKLKASYGVTGNQAIPDFASLPLYSGNAAYGGQAGQAPSQLGNPDLKWETTLGSDLGFEAAFLKNRINLEVDVYKRNTKDLILNRSVPGTSGFSTQYANVGNLNNKGIEVSISTTNISTRNLRWTTTLNYSANRNKITNLGGQLIGDGVNKAMEGQPLGVFVAREYAGVDPANGDPIYYKKTIVNGKRDRSTTNDYNEAEDVVIGNPNPDFIYGFGNNVTYKGFDLDILLQGVQGNQIFFGGGQYMSANGSNGFDNQTIDQLRAWKKPGDITDVPKAILGESIGTNNSSRYISDGSYLRFKSVSLGYTLPASITKRVKIDRLRVYVRAENLFTFTKYTGWDPEVNADYQASNINQGVDFYSAPQIKSVVFGVSLGL